MAHSPSRSGRPPIQQLQTVADLLDSPALARLYAHILQYGPITVSEIVDTLDIPQGTAYDYVQNLETAGLVEKSREQRPYEYDAEAIALTLSTDGETQTITPALIAAVARRDEDEDIDVYIERHGLDGLAAALEYAYEYIDGTVNHRIAARELDLSPLEAEIILQALEPVAAEYADAAA
ncbi:helix-turn-helix domain-containing protein [Halomarina salina]|uniref:Helix-turn-helix domain-containing protein n=1 Tax=Halomarina salina TaxID=1872699 RepID=A0ABD5RTN0_9EURY|nr:MarR family transcriptional regulator [Halomarina salina]